MKRRQLMHGEHLLVKKVSHADLEETGIALEVYSPFDTEAHNQYIGKVGRLEEEHAVRTHNCGVMVLEFNNGEQFAFLGTDVERTSAWPTPADELPPAREGIDPPDDTPEDTRNMRYLNVTEQAYADTLFPTFYRIHHSSMTLEAIWDLVVDATFERTRCFSAEHHYEVPL